MEVTPAWVDNVRNLLLIGEGFYLSYNPNARHAVLTDLGNMLGADLKDGEETALCVEDKGEQIWYILEGDFKKEYAEAFPNGLNAVLGVYNKHKEKHRSNWSTD